ncbi:hypothetical protein KKF91_09175 [Myxococcota bacterium]|nr:hypothetical protein [Myxococcota bacterium]
MSWAALEWRHIARVTFQLQSPLSLATGRSSLFYDNEVFTDANGLPAIPGTSLAGALRAAARLHGGDERALFGHESGGKDNHNGGQRARLSFSHAVIHDSNDRPAAPLLGGAQLNDALLSAARAHVVRDHVRLDSRGTADGAGKFDRSSVMAGHRFTFEVELEAEAASWAVLDQLIAWMNHPAFRLGGRTRAGLGQIKLLSYQARAFNLRQSADWAAYGALPADLSKPAVGLQARDIPKVQTAGVLTTTLKLKPMEPWIVAGGEGDADIEPMREARVVWTVSGRGRVKPSEDSERLLLPGSSIKGALRHRAAFHLRALRGIWADHAPPPPMPHNPDLDPWAARDGLEALFGQVHGLQEGIKGDGETEGEAGIAGCVYIDDVRPKGKTKIRHHVTLDRFTGGPMMGHLFTDNPVESDEITLSITVAPTRLLPRDVWEAFHRALEDITEGRLQFGGGSGRGYGWFRGDAPVWSGEVEPVLERAAQMEEQE